MSEANSPSRPAIAVVGVSALFPGSLNATGFWKDILAGTDLITDVPPTHWLIEDYYDPDPSVPDKTYAKRGAFLSDVDFDSLSWGVPPSIVPETDTSQLLALIVAQRVLEDAAKGKVDDLDRSAISVILGVTSGQELLGSMVSRLQRPIWVKSMRDAGLPEDEVEDLCDRISSHYTPWNESTFPGLLGNVVAGRIANRLDLGGTNCVTDAACASTFSALSMAVNELQLGDSDMVITGGVDTLNDIFMFMCFSKTPALSPSGDCRPFSDKADGTMLGEGLGMVALKRLSDAERDGDRIYAVINGVGTSSDGRAKSVYAPRAEGQALAIERAYDRAGYGPDTVELIEAHGTGTTAGDAAEFGGLKMSFDRSGREDRQWCSLGSVKSQVGHTKAAAGAAGLFKVVMALHHQVLPPTIKIDRPNPALEIESSPFNLTTRARPWVRSSAHPRRGSVSSFGFGGSNFHIALSEYSPNGEAAGALRAERLRTLDSELVLLCAATGAELVKKAREIATSCSEAGSLVWLAHSSQASFDATDGARLAVVATDEAGLAAELVAIAGMIESNPEKAFTTPKGSSYGVGACEGKLGYLFPGQGSQYLDMGADLAMAFAPAISVWDAAADKELNHGTRLHEVVFPITAFGDEQQAAQHDKLKATRWAQPAIGCTSLSLLAMLQGCGLSADSFAGHSFGEVSALCAAGVLSPEDFVAVARRRGELMEEAAKTPGAMVAVSMPIDELRPLIESWGCDVVVANHNGPSQVVLSGPTDAIEEVEGKLDAAGVVVRHLPVATAFHSPIVHDASDAFKDYLKGVVLRAPKRPVFSNFSAEPYPSGGQVAKDHLADQLVNTVRFVEIIEAMYESGVRSFVEVGPASVLTGLVAGILGDRPHRAIALDRKGKSGVATFLTGLGALAAAGQTVDCQALWQDYAVPMNPAELPKPKLSIEINGANHGKPYPPAGGACELPPPNPRGRRQSVVEAPSPVSAQPVAAAAPALPKPQPAQATPPPAPMAVQTVAAAPEREETFRLAQQQTADAHSSYMQAMSRAHTAYLDTVDRGFQLLAQSPASASVSVAMPASLAVASIAPAPLPVPVVAPVIVPVAAPVSALVAAVVAAPAAGIDVEALLLEVVSEKTGYPIEMLTMEMDLEGDLGVDSIKRVEILSGVREKAPEMPEVDTAVMASLATLGQIVEHMSAQVPAVAAVAAAPVPAVAAIDVEALLLEVVSEKTGYPIEMLTMEMDLEGDLGVDSIKRVEILSGVREKAPEMPEVDTAVMASLATLGQIVEHMSAQVPAVAAVAAAPVPAVAAIDVEALLLEVVSEKTGYPIEMLTMEMDLEGDLGVDSIKRVEILSGVREKAPEMPEVDTAVMASLATLGQIVEHMSAQAPAGVVVSEAPAASIDIEGLLLEVVSEKTGYPIEMLTMEMDLEGDLGVDSIKRVEILSGVREKAPEMPEVDTAVMASLQTLGQIVEHMAEKAGHSAPSSSAAGQIETTEAVSAAQADTRLGRFTLETVARPPIGMARPGLFGEGRLVVTSDGTDLADHLVRALQARGVSAEAVEEIPETGLRGLVFLGGLRAVESVDEAIQINREAFAAAQAAGASLADSERAAGVFITVQDTGGDFGAKAADSNRAWLAGCAGLARTLSQEWSNVAVKAIDLERGGRSTRELAVALADELVFGGSELDIGLSASGQRVGLRSVRVPIDAATELSLGESDVIVVSGGARGVTAACVIELARHTKSRFVLLGRSEITAEPASCAGLTADADLKKALLADLLAAGVKTTPRELGRSVARIRSVREIRQTLATLESLGSESRYLSVDVTDGAALEAALAGIRSELGPITGVVHGAGVIADRFVVEKTAEQFDRVFDTKIEGLRALMRATASDDLKLLCLFSSVAARCGNSGQSDYAMANEILNKVAQAEAGRRGEGCVVKALGWGPWKGGMVSPELEALFEAKGVPLIPLARGAQMFVDEIGSGNASGIELVLGGEPKADSLLPEDANSTSELVLSVARSSHPYLVDHAIKGTPVVPVAMVLEWFERVARSFTDGLVLAKIRDLKVLRGIPLRQFADSELHLLLRCEQLSNGDGSTVALELADTQGKPFYRCIAELVQERPAPEDGQDATELDLENWGDRLVYDGEILFHGPQFQMIRNIEGISDRGVAAQLSGVVEAKWDAIGDQGSWYTDPVAIDGGLQLSLLWCERVLGGRSLPTGIEEVRTWVDRPVTGRIQCTLVGRSAAGQKSVSDLWFRDETGRLVAELKGVETHLLPDQDRVDTRA